MVVFTIMLPDVCGEMSLPKAGKAAGRMPTLRCEAAGLLGEPSLPFLEIGELGGIAVSV